MRGPKGREGEVSWGWGREPPPHQLESLGERCGAFWDLKIASEQCNGIKYANETFKKGSKNMLSIPYFTRAPPMNSTLSARQATAIKIHCP